MLTYIPEITMTILEIIAPPPKSPATKKNWRQIPVKTENFNLRKASWCGYQFSPAYFGDNTCAIY